MNDRIKEHIINVLTAIGLGSFAIGVFPGCIPISIFIPEAPLDVIMAVAGIVTFVAGIMVIILLPLFGKKKSKPVKADVFVSPYRSYEELSQFLSGALATNGYHLVKTSTLEPEGAVSVYADMLKGSEWNCVSVIRVPELTEEWTEAANDAITDILTGESGQATIYAYVNMISIFCVDRITPAFRSLVNSNMEQGLKNGRLVAGISFGGKRVYVAKQVGGLYISKYKKLRKSLIQILELQEDKENNTGT